MWPRSSFWEVILQIKCFQKQWPSFLVGEAISAVIIQEISTPGSLWAITFTPALNLESPINLTLCMSLECGRNPRWHKKNNLVSNTGHSCYEAVNTEPLHECIYDITAKGTAPLLCHNFPNCLTHPSHLHHDLTAHINLLKISFFAAPL